MKHLSYWVTAALAVCWVACSKNTEPTTQKITEDIIGEWEYIASSTSTVGDATYHDWRLAPHLFTGGKYQSIFLRNSDLRVVQQYTDTSAVGEYTGKYFVTHDGDSLVLALGASQDVIAARTAVHSLKSDTLILKAYIRNADSFYYWMYVK